ncbi:ABC transporter ATP-binding protein [Roseomonas elaeocarpi]|uniref:ABC transporter ATP-binding protein n=1 Tax=Roseomonas elaeocarpi TaxID=907779 RepID=A0ABV6JLP9_9PROT
MPRLQGVVPPVVTSEPVLSVSGLRAEFTAGGNTVTAVSDVDLVIPAGETLALVGESGSGKSVTSLSLLRLLPRGVGRVAAGRIRFAPPGETPMDLAALDAEALRQVRGRRIGVVFQEPMTSLNPVFTVGQQVGEPLRVHQGASRDTAFRSAVRLLDRVGIPDAPRRARQYPHELSGGMRQRVTIAMALACDPALLIADEPTTALDVTIQAQILDLLGRQQRERGMAMLFVTHNLGVVATIADRVAVMYAGRVVEDGSVAEVFRAPRHPYTAGLMRSMPQLGKATALRRAGQFLPSIPGTVPSLTRMPPGCAFAPRCPMAAPACDALMPALEIVAPGHHSRCLRWREMPS